MGKILALALASKVLSRGVERKSIVAGEGKARQSKANLPPFPFLSGNLQKAGKWGNDAEAGASALVLTDKIKSAARSVLIGGSGLVMRVCMSRVWTRVRSGTA